jgi:hypothetical protein
MAWRSGVKFAKWHGVRCDLGSHQPATSDLKFHAQFEVKTYNVALPMGLNWPKSPTYRRANVESFRKSTFVRTSAKLCSPMDSA